MSAILRTQGLSKHWGALKANSDITLSLLHGARHAIIGPNGAGKTTLLNLLAGTLVPTSGEILLDDERVTRLPPHRRVRRGLARTFQVTTLFPGLTALESVLLAVLERRGRAGVWWRPVARDRAAGDEAMDILGRLRLQDDAHAVTRTLPYGRQRLLEIAVALASAPRILLLDEPAAGIPADESNAVMAGIAALPRDVSILFVEHDMGLVFRFAERITVMAAGRVLAEGTPAEIAADRRVRSIYLGEQP